MRLSGGDYGWLVLFVVDWCLLASCVHCCCCCCCVCAFVVVVFVCVFVGGCCWCGMLVGTIGCWC